MLQSLLGFLPILLLNLDFRFHEHEDGVITDAEVLSKCLFEEVVSRTHVACIAIDDGCEDVCLNNRGVLVQAVIDLTEGPRCIIKEPSGLGKKDLCLSEGRVLLCHILEELDGLDKVFGWASRCHLGFGAAMDEIFLSKLHQEVSIQLDVEVEVGHGGLGLLDVQVQGGVKETDSLNFVASEAPFKLGFEEGVFGALAL